MRCAGHSTDGGCKHMCVRTLWHSQDHHGGDIGSGGVHAGLRADNAADTGRRVVSTCSGVSSTSGGRSKSTSVRSRAGCSGTGCTCCRALAAAEPEAAAAGPVGPRADCCCACAWAGLPVCRIGACRTGCVDPFLSCVPLDVVCSPGGDCRCSAGCWMPGCQVGCGSCPATACRRLPAARCMRGLAGEEPVWLDLLDTGDTRAGAGVSCNPGGSDTAGASAGVTALDMGGRRELGVGSRLDATAPDATGVWMLVATCCARLVVTPKDAG